MIRAAFASKIIDAARTFSEKQETPKDVIVELEYIETGKYKVLTNIISNEQKQQIDSIFQARKALILNELTNTDYKIFAQILNGTMPAITRLKKLSDHDHAFFRKWDYISSDPLMIAYSKWLQENRLDILKTLTPDIINKISMATTLAQVTQATKGALLPIDAATPEVKAIKQVQTTKFSQLTKFKPVRQNSQLSVSSFTANDLNFEAEITALYLGDFKYSRLEPDSIVVSKMLRDYLEAFELFIFFRQSIDMPKSRKINR